VPSESSNPNVVVIRQRSRTFVILLDDEGNGRMSAGFP
jgi:hypothetical protein